MLSHSSQISASSCSESFIGRIMMQFSSLAYAFAIGRDLSGATPRLDLFTVHEIGTISSIYSIQKPCSTTEVLAIIIGVFQP